MATFTGSNASEILSDLIIGPIQGIGNDFVDALGGDDIAIGWSGDDVIRGGSGADVIIGGLLNAAGIVTPSGIDAADYTTSVDGVTIDLSLTVSLTLPMLGINLQLVSASQGFGGDAQGDYLQGITNLIGSNTGGDNLTGTVSANTFNGQGGNDVLNGMGGNDILLGGAGDDWLIGGAGADSLQGGAGLFDTADYSTSVDAVTISLMSGTGSGGDAQGDTLTGIERLIGSAGDDTLAGSAGNDTIIGGAGADVLVGNAGIDTADYSGSSAAVNVDLAAGSGSGGEAQGDTLSNIENLIGSAFNDTLTGSSAANILSGGNGDDVLQGGAGADTLDGGAGIDTVSYAASSAGVTIDLRLLGPQVSSGDANGDTLTGIEIIRGSVFADIITGDANDNIFTDGGVGAADILTGGAGNDTYSVYNAGTAIVEIGGEGNDRVSAGVNYVLASGASVEYLNTTSLQGTRATNLTGNELAQLVRGNDGGNVIDGGGGNDTLWGMGGADTFLFSSALGSGGVARIGDFNVADDQIQLDSAIFSALDLGGLDASAFKDNASAPRDADDFIIYNSNTGSLFYDADGGGSAFRAVKFASLSAGLNLSAADFLVI
ncbi:calcium-binding protein [Sinorhizobium sp. RAC02]|uniref:calcium-binding protein n=1 Tax=Sinorhizobium sp. RAC02 TaxID=1842534 RepID=UPI00083D04F0|nr:calcium-binding protein [Sinorhizobium sp. RAC02]AOF93679.1 hemolysin-type calcium-binding repeat family protein [Sinorhizobium sp. RAC02]